MHDEKTPTWSVVLCDSLEKVFADTPPRPMNTEIPVPIIAGEEASLQIAFRPPVPSHPIEVPGVRITVAPVSGLEVTISQVELVPVTLPSPDTADEHYLRTTPGLYPDLLRPAARATHAHTRELRPVPGQWRSAWISLRAIGPVQASDITLEVEANGGEHLASFSVPLEVYSEELPELPIPHTHWFHADGLAHYYGDEVWSEGHWQSIDAFLGAARDLGANMILTPVWTPPLDTAIGSYRLPTQLVSITQDSGAYTFDWSRLHRWLDLIEKHGFTYIEVPHLFTQWGAKHAPAFYLSSDAGGSSPHFGWHTPATDPAYRAFLEQLLPALQRELSHRWDLDRVYFHISDEPVPADLAHYRAAHGQVADLLAGRNLIDAISDIELRDDDLVQTPVVATDHADAFQRAGIAMWLYYCVGQERDVANRFIALPSARNRVIGAQLYETGARGFLHWGFNFYNTYHSTAPLDPFTDTCAGGGFFGGDPFAVYPGEGRQPLRSIRFEVFREAITDLRLMYALERRAGRERVLPLIDQDGELRLEAFTYDPDHYRRVAVELVRALKENRSTPSTPIDS